MPMPSQQITIVTICYNVKEELEKTIQSVQNQICKSYEFIIVDGGSTDGTLEVINKYSSCVTKWISEADNGIYDAMNKGIDLASGDWIIFMNAGDVFYDTEVIQQLAERNYSSNVGIVYGDVELDFGRAGKLIKCFKKFSKDDVVLEMCHQGVMTRSDILKRIHYDTSFRIMADLNSFNTIYNLGYILEYIPITFSTFEVTGGISSNKPLLSFKELCRIKSIKKDSFEYKTLYIRAIIRYLLQRLIPKRIYNLVRYRKVSSIKQYKSDN